MGDTLILILVGIGLVILIGVSSWLMTRGASRDQEEETRLDSSGGWGGMNLTTDAEEE